MSFLERMITRLRWTALATVLLITLAWPMPGRTGHQIWLLVLVFITYNAAVELVRWYVPRLRSYSWVSLLDLPVAAMVYFLDAEPGGPLFVFFYVAVLTAATWMTPRQTLVYTLVVATLLLLIAPTLPDWSTSHENLRQIAARIIVLGVLGAVTAILTRRLAVEQEQARQVQDEAARLEELDRLRREFISMISHDLQTPLTAGIAGLGMLEASSEDRLTVDERRLLSNVRRNLALLRILINDLLASSQLEAGVMTLDFAPLDLRTVVMDVIASVHPLLLEKQQVLDVDVPEALPLTGDARRLGQTLINLLANAYTHSPPGTSVSLSARAGPADRITITVRDNGPGIPPEHLEHVFERFYRFDPKSSGSGLGLAIAHGLVEMHGGRIWAESQTGIGTAIFVELPRSQGIEEVE